MKLEIRAVIKYFCMKGMPSNEIHEDIMENTGKESSSNSTVKNEFRRGRALNCFVCFFAFTSQVNSYGHGRAVNSPSHTYSLPGLNKWFTSNSCKNFCL